MSVELDVDRARVTCSSTSGAVRAESLNTARQMRQQCWGVGGALQGTVRLPCTRGRGRGDTRGAGPREGVGPAGWIDCRGRGYRRVAKLDFLV